MPTLHLEYDEWDPLIDQLGPTTSILDHAGIVLHPRLAAVLERAGFRTDQPVECEPEPGATALIFRQPDGGSE